MNPSYTGAPDRAQDSTTSKRDNFTRDQFDWLRQVAFDNGLPPAASRVAVALTQYFSRKHDGWAWMAQATIAHDLGMSERTARSALSALNERGHLVTKRRGKMETNLYHLALKNSEGDRQSVADHDRQPIAAHDRRPIATHTGVTGKNLQSDRQKTVEVTGNPLPPNPLKEPIEEPIERGAPQARPATDSFESCSLGNTESLESPLVTIVDDGDGESGVAVAPPPDHLQRAVARARRLMQGGAQ
jgi:hypothetical protein